MNLVVLLLLAPLLSSCSGSDVASDVNKPLAEEHIPIAANFDQANAVVASFAARNHFAVQPLISSPQGPVLFSMRLFRDDISVIVIQLRGEPLRVTAYPLCACELNHRLGLRSAADEAVSDLRRDLLQLR